MSETPSERYDRLLAESYKHHQAVAMRALLSYMSERCKVRSQHKLPDRHELVNTVTARLVGVEWMEWAIDRALENGTIREYGPYLSDREINVL